MMKPAAFCILLAACATGGAGAGGIRVDREAAPHAAAPRLDLHAAASEGTRVFPVAIDPQLPSADRIGREIRGELGEVASAEIRLCVAADGRVHSVQLVRGSSLAEFNEAVVHDVASWQFSGSPGWSRPNRLKSCELATIRYRPHR